MDQPEKIEFTVDGQYENEKGIFTVLSMHRGQMVIRWENGEEIKTDIELQRRIAERRQWEENKRLAEAEAALNPVHKSGGKKSVFPGFAPTDFKKSASGTTWRSRYQLGAAVTQKIETTRFNFNSWAFGHKPEMHVQDVKHHGHAAADAQAVFFVRVDQETLHYGFQVVRPDNNDGAGTDWEAFSKWLALPENDQLLRSIAAGDNLTACNRTTPSSIALSASDDGWRIENNGQSSARETLSAYIQDTPETEPFELEITATMDKSAAVAGGLDIAKNIAQLFTQLLPLYKAAVTR